MTSPPASTILDEKDRASVPEQIRPDSSLERDKAALLAPPSLSPKTTRTSGDGLRIHGNASTPANIGGNTDIERADSVHSLGAGGIGPDRVRRRRNRRAPDSSWNPRAPPAPRRANSLPVDPVTIVPATPKIDFGHALSKMLVPQQKLAPAPTWTLSAVNIMKYSYLNILLVFVPVSWACHFTGQQPTIIFIFSFLAIIPLAALLGFATEELALRVGQTLGGLLNATFGNAVELIIAILALVRGSFASYKPACSEVFFLIVYSSLACASSLVVYASTNRDMAFGRPSSIYLCCCNTANGQTPGEAAGESAAIEEAHVLAISRGTSIILLFVYACYLFFQLWTHAYIYTPEASAHHAAKLSNRIRRAGSSYITKSIPHALATFPSIHFPRQRHVLDQFYFLSLHRGRRNGAQTQDSSDHILLATVTVLTGVTAEWLVDSIDGLTKNGNISREFVALILLPLVGNAAEHVTAVTVSVKNKLDLAITVAVGSSIQIALFVLPFLILLGWMIGQPLTLFFDIFETVVVFVSVLIINYAISDGKTNWLEGLVLMVVYVIIGLSVWYYPGAVSTSDNLFVNMRERVML
ncbi:Sodium/calcium exchanger protein [Rhizoctonia solani]|uniref:Sodium/calcium exchanger protein n=1 Tax=Rhizoctonia solani TaxID=456999 RepID=A0A8H7I9H0_9AGAM|nr:Sodium/calcium exchanger protein [Rhizoctonia solani]